MFNKWAKYIFLFFLFTIIIMASVGCRRGLDTEKSLTYNLGADPKIIDPALSMGEKGANVIAANFEGLMKLDKNSKAIPGIALSCTKDSDVKYTFKLRDAKWSDGKPVTAYDFEYAWKRVLNPDTQSKCAYELYCIKNAEGYNNKTCDASSVGVLAIDEKTLEVVLECPTAYFLEALSSPIYMPVREDIINEHNGNWAKNSLTYIGNGPFKMVLWRANDSIEFVKNENYYDKDNVRLNKLVFKMVEDPEIYFAKWEEGDLDIIESPPASEIPKLKGENSLAKSPYLGVYFYTFNNNKKPLDDKRVRKALNYAIDRTAIINSVLKNESSPAIAFIPTGIPDANINADFRESGGSFFKPEGQLDEARKLLSEAGYPNGEGFPAVTLIYNNSGIHKDIAQAIQLMWQRNLNINISLKAVDLAGLQNIKDKGDYDIIRQGWIGDYIDPMTFFDYIKSGELKYNNNLLNELIDDAKVELDPIKRMAILHSAEKALMDDMLVMPIFSYTNTMVIKPEVKEVFKSPLGVVYFNNAYIADNK